MAKSAVLFLVCLSMVAALLVFPSISPASQGQDQRLLKKASDHLNRLTKDKKRRKFHHEWEKCIAELDTVIRKYPRSEPARKALFLKAEAYSGIFRLSRAQSDMDLAVESYEQYLGKYPKSADASKARKQLEALTGVEPSAAHKTEKAKEPAASVSTEEKAVSTGKKSAESTQETAITSHPDDTVFIKEIRHWSNTGYTRVVIDLGGKVTFKASRLRGPDRLVFDIRKGSIGSPLKDSPVVVNDGILKTIRASQYNGETVRVVLDLESIANYRALMLPDPQRLVIDVEGKKAVSAKRTGRGRVITLKSAKNEGPAPILNISSTTAPQKCVVRPEQTEQPATTAADTGQDSDTVKVPATRPEPSQETAPSCKPETSGNTTGRLCIGTIVIDPGHGGKDTGAIGKKGLYEKDVVLDIGLKLREIIRKELGCKVVMTRDRDVFIDLSARPGIAIKNDADLFISVHANASLDRAARGIETYLLNTTKDRNIMALAARENMMTIDKMSDLYTIIKELKLDSKREDSLRLAHVVQANLVKDLKRINDVNDKGVKQGPFLVLYGAEMPSILTEVGFISNPEEEAELGSPEYRQNIAQAIFDGIKEYIVTSKPTTAALSIPAN